MSVGRGSLIGRSFWLTLAAIVVVFLVALALVSCSSATQDRSGAAGGKDPDAMADATHVVVYRNADSVPNVALFCIGEMRFASTLSGGDSGKDKASALMRLPEQDSICRSAR